jgi:transposase
MYEASDGQPRLGRSASCEHHLLTDATGLPLAFTLTAANRNDITQLLPLVEKIKPLRGPRGRPRKRPAQVIADRGYDSDKHRRELRRRGIKPTIARRGTEHGSGLGVYRWVIERSFSWLHQFRRLRTRYERDPQMHEAFMHLGCAIICWRRLTSL